MPTQERPCASRHSSSVSESGTRPGHLRWCRDRHTLRSPKPSDLSPILHDQHLLPPWLDSGQGHEGAGQFSVAAPWSVFSCRRQSCASARFAKRNTNLHFSSNLEAMCTARPMDDSMSSARAFDRGPASDQFIDPPAPPFRQQAKLAGEPLLVRQQSSPFRPPFRSDVHSVASSVTSLRSEAEQPVATRPAVGPNLGPTASIPEHVPASHTRSAPLGSRSRGAPAASPPIWGSRAAGSIPPPSTTSKQTRSLLTDRGMDDRPAKLFKPAPTAAASPSDARLAGPVHRVWTRPPSIEKSEPVTLSVLSLASSSARSATSSGRVKRPVTAPAAACAATSPGLTPALWATV